MAFFLDQHTPAGTALFFYFKAPDAKAAPALTCAGPTMPPEGANRRNVYFLKHESKVPDAYDDLLSVVQYGVCTDNLLQNMASMLREIYIPAAGATPEGAAAIAPAPAAAAAAAAPPPPQAQAKPPGEAAKDEYKRNLVWFESVLAHAAQQVKGDVMLEIPDADLADPKAAAEDYDVVSKLETATESWTKLVASVVEAENAKRPRTKGPLAEIEFWRQRNAALSALYEQIQMPHVQQILKVLKLADAQAVSSFSYNFGELQKLYVEAKDNVKFLTTLERHFKNITHGSFATILDTLPSMMNAIRMVWIISRHYNTDLRMVPLMERVAYKIAEKVETEVNIATILRRAPDRAKQVIMEAQAVLNGWESTYMAVRQRIEESGTHIRWEFDRKRLFELTKYMAHVCGHLHEVATVLDQFHQFLGPELRAVTGESEGIDEVVLRVERLVEPLESVPFNIFDRRYRRPSGTRARRLLLRTSRGRHSVSPTPPKSAGRAAGRRGRRSFAGTKTRGRK